MSLDTDQPLKNVRILFVEDVLDLRELITEVLEQKGASVTAVTQAQEALEAHKSHEFDIIVSNIILPGVDGYSLLRQVRTIETQLGSLPTPAIALTVAATVVEREEAIAAGFQAHLPKPFKIKELTSLIVSLVRA